MGIRNTRFFIAVFFVTFLSSCAGGIFGGSVKKGYIKVMSYNVHHCNPPSRPGFIDVDAVAAVIKKANPDVVALQEIDVNVKRSGTNDQGLLLAQKTGYPAFYFAKAIDHDGGDYGGMILSKYKLTDKKTYRLPTDETTGGEPRVLATATVQLPGGRLLKFGSTHLDAQKAHVNRVLQVKEILRITAPETLPMIVAGDFNAEENSEVIQLLDQGLTRTCSGCLPTIPQVNPRKAIDFIAYKNGGAFSLVSHKVIREGYASDHLPVIAILKLK